jgi:formylglycine-generating enzyme required for sulfatase activity
MKIFFLVALALAGSLSGVQTARAQAPEGSLRLDLGSGVSMDLVLVKAGTFRQGSPTTEAERGEDESQREVTLTRDFYMGKNEVTVGQFRRFVDATGYKTEAEKGTSGGFGWNGQALEQRSSFNWRNPGFSQTDEHPVTLVTFEDAVAFTRWLSNQAGREVSLPTEAQWEFAARTNSTSAYPSGAAKATQASALGWSKANASSGTRPVGQKSPNGIGLFDLAGNVAEWCLDWYGPYAAGPVTDPMETRQNLSDKPRRVLRGGSWLRDPRNGRSAARHRNAPGTRNADNGFRVVASTSGPAAAPHQGAAGPTTTAPADGTSTISGGGALGLFIGFLAAGLGVVYLLGKAMVRLFLGGGASGARAEIAPDGFTIKAPKVPAGHRIHYRYMVDGKTQTGSVVSSGDPEMGQLVYTGGRPSSVQILAVTALGEALPLEKPAPAPAPSPRPTTRDDDSFRGYPSAYR